MANCRSVEPNNIIPKRASGQSYFDLVMSLYEAKDEKRYRGLNKGVGFIHVILLKKTNPLDFRCIFPKYPSVKNLYIQI